VKAAVLYEYKQPLVVEEVEVDQPKAGEVDRTDPSPRWLFAPVIIVR